MNRYNFFSMRGKLLEVSNSLPKSPSEVGGNLDLEKYRVKFHHDFMVAISQSQIKVAMTTTG